MMENEQYLTDLINNCDNVNKRRSSRLQCDVKRPLMLTTNRTSSSSTLHSRKSTTTKLNQSSSGTAFGSHQNEAVYISSLFKTLIVTLNMFINNNNKKLFFFAFVLFNSIIVLHSSRVGPKNLENFCR